MAILNLCSQGQPGCIFAFVGKSFGMPNKNRKVSQNDNNIYKYRLILRPKATQVNE